jgi:phosphate-selective porin OprO and OprP
MLYGTSDINTFISDIMFKYSGFALYAEYIRRDASNPLTYNADNDLRYVYEGSGFNIQASYMLPNYLEFAGRYTAITPDKELEVATLPTRQYTLAASRYIRWHRVKIQSDLTYQDVLLENDIFNSQDGWLFRFQVEV